VRGEQYRSVGRWRKHYPAFCFVQFIPDFLKRVDAEIDGVSLILRQPLPRFLDAVAVDRVIALKRFLCCNDGGGDFKRATVSLFSALAIESSESLPAYRFTPVDRRKCDSKISCWS
jgi:hypothetical protein